MITDFIILLNNTCNLSCRYCNFTEKDPRNAQICTPERLRKAVELYFAHLKESPPGPAVLSFNADGEALHTEELLFEGLELAHSLRKGRSDTILVLVTNATLIRPDTAARLAALDVSVTVSLDGDALSHDRHRVSPGGGPTHERAMEGIRLLREAGIRPSVRALVTPETSSRLMESFDFLRQLHPSRAIKLRPLRREESPRYRTEWVSRFAGAYSACVSELLSRGTPLEELPDDAIYFGRFLEEGMGRGPYCSSGHGMLWMTPDGSLYPCGLLTEEEACGHLDSLGGPADLEALLESPASLRVRNRSPDLREPCLSCGWLEACRGGCPAVGLEGTPPLCDFYRSLGETMEKHSYFSK